MQGSAAVPAHLLQIDTVYGATGAGIGLSVRDAVGQGRNWYSRKADGQSTREPVRRTVKVFHSTQLYASLSERLDWSPFVAAWPRSWIVSTAFLVHHSKCMAHAVLRGGQLAPDLAPIRG